MRNWECCKQLAYVLRHDFAGGGILEEPGYGGAFVDEDADEAARLRQRFVTVKSKLRDLAVEEGLLGESS